jgi:hypothetical protein
MGLLTQLACVLVGHRWTCGGTGTTDEFADMGYPSITLTYRKCGRCGLEEHDRAGYELVSELRAKRRESPSSPAEGEHTVTGADAGQPKS